ncbi:arf-GAP with Rho-GAP domain, ANK repeat and PH domain-containing protein 1-like [Petromyzon marinus]|uniref:Arf-GAP with Rho-GAP domain, ANK repeat and PH domain-containing protein 1-like n=1 Tax=Petromyzon marinus TaxID=7757 RepID=A0AAJ7UF97_PETMA|nr:arf-GAP with Rho-GAP domain, ANK repeat and PH domain-containing protein 1-like [Petromyzon marinus]
MDWFLSLGSVTSVDRGQGVQPGVKVTVKGDSTISLTFDSVESRESLLKALLAVTTPLGGPPWPPWGRLVTRGALGLKGLRVLGVLHALCLHVHRDAQEAEAGLGLLFCDTRTMSVKEQAATTFTVTTPQVTYKFSTDSESERDSWLASLREAQEEALGDPELLERLSAVPGNESCADCGAPGPAWASLNLAVVVCTQCAGAHRSLGQNASRIRSLTIDQTAWTVDVVQMLLALGNERSNSFWAALVPPSEALGGEGLGGRGVAPTAADRADFVRAKYVEGKYRKVHRLYGSRQELQEALLEAVQRTDVLETLTLLFSGAEATAAAYAAALRGGQRAQAELISQNINTDLSGPVPPSPRHCVHMKGFLSKTKASTRPIDKRKSRDDFSLRWCTLQASALRYHLPGAPSGEPRGEISCRDIAGVFLQSGAHHGLPHTMQIHVLGRGPSEKLFLFGDEDEDNLRSWARGLIAESVPPWARALASGPWELVSHVGRATVQGVSLGEGGRPVGGLPPGRGALDWVPAWSRLSDASLLVVLEPPQRGGRGLAGGGTAAAAASAAAWDIAGGEGGGAEEGEETIVINLRRLHNLSVSSEGSRAKPDTSIRLVDRNWSLCIRLPGILGPARASSLVKSARGGAGRPLSQQPITDEDVVLAVAKCVEHVEQYGLMREGLYRTVGVASATEALVERLWADPRSAVLEPGQGNVELAASALKAILRQAPTSLIPSGSEWTSVAREADPQVKADKYRQRIASLPSTQRSTLHYLLQHLHKVQLYSSQNRMPVENLVTIFIPALFHTDLLEKQTARLLRDLIEMYPSISQGAHR